MRVLQHQTDMPEKSQNFFGGRNFLKLNYYKSNTGWSASPSRSQDTGDII
ncbi:MAG: hypothetical protein WC198_04345 [Victivallaceae bacterium]|jgi:hypothetical protein